MEHSRLQSQYSIETSGPQDNPVPIALIGATLFLAVLLLLIGVSEFGGSSEAREAQVMQVMLRDGAYFYPTRNGIIPSKPPLMHWIGAGVSSLLGGNVTEFSARLPSAVFSALILFLVLRHAARPKSKVTDDPHEPIAVSVLAGTILVSSYAFAVMAGDARVDITFAFFFTAALLLFLKRLEEIIYSQRNLLIAYDEKFFVSFYILCALAVLSKGPLGLVLPVACAVVAAACVAGPTAAVRLFLKPRWGWLCFLVLVMPWYIGAIIEWRTTFVGRQLIFENIARFLGDKETNAEAWWFYGPSFLRSVFPWSVISILVAAWDIMRFKRRLGLPRNLGLDFAPDLARRIYAVPFVVGFLLFSIASGKRHSYLMPLLPVLSIYLAAGLQEIWFSCTQVKQRQALRLLTWAIKVVVAICLIVAAAFYLLPLLADNAEGARQSKLIFEWLEIIGSRAGLVLIACGGAYIVASLYNSWTRMLFAMLAVAALFQVAVLVGVGAKYHLKGFRNMAAQVAAAVGPGSLSVVRTHQDEYFDPLLFYLRRKVQLQDPALPLIQCSQDAFILGRSSYFSGLPASIAAVLRDRLVFPIRTASFQDPQEHAIMLVECNAGNKY